MMPASRPPVSGTGPPAAGPDRRGAARGVLNLPQRWANPNGMRIARPAACSGSLPPPAAKGRTRRSGLPLLAALVFAGGLVAATPGPAMAQFDPFGFLRPPGSVPQAPRQNRPARQVRPNPGGWWIFQPPQPQETYIERPPPVARKREPPPEPEGQTYSSADAASQGKRTPPDQFVLVIGDRLADQLAQGLADNTVPERARLAVIRNSAEDSGFLPGAVDWLARSADAITAARPSVTVVALGSEDLQPIKDGDTLHEPLTERWVELYSRRVDAVLAAVRAKAGRVVVVGLAPVANGKLSEDYAKLNEILRARASRAGATFAPLWDGFVDEDGKYIVFGPAVDGQRRRLRLADGVRFTRAGGRKLAFFVQKELNRLIADPAKPGAGASGPEAASRTSALAGGPGAKPQDTQVQAVSARALAEGVAPAPVRGRTDDFTWPPPAADLAPARIAAP